MLGVSAQRGSVVTRSLQSVPRVSDVQVSMDHNTATVRFDESRASVDALCEAIREAGYGVERAGAATHGSRRSHGGCCG